MLENIIPSKPFTSYEDLDLLSHRFVNRVKRIQADFCDGHFVKSVSWPVSEYGIKQFQDLHLKNDLDIYLPHWEELDYTADLMVSDPEKYLDSVACLGFDEVIIHFRSVEKNLQVFKEIFSKVENYSFGLYLGIDVKTDLSQVLSFLEKNLEKFSGVQVMGIENIGFQGQVFSEKSLEVVKMIKAKFPNIKVMMDGGLDDETVWKAQEAGVDTFCIGHFITEPMDPKEELKYLRDL
jgi:ribulose-phosphate 3-epimerase